MGMPEEHAKIFRQIHMTNTVPSKVLAIYDIAKKKGDQANTRLTPQNIVMISTMAELGLSPIDPEVEKVREPAVFTGEKRKAGRPKGSKNKKEPIPAQVRTAPEHPRALVDRPAIAKRKQLPDEVARHAGPRE